jgi:hypothetical protein
LFLSNATDLVAGDTDKTSDIFVRDLKTNVTTLATVNRNNKAGGVSSSVYSLSDNGQMVAFVSDATDMVAKDTNGKADIFVRDIKAGKTKLVSINSAHSGSGNGKSRDPKISLNGRFVRFNSEASNLVAGDTNGKEDLFVHDLVTGKTFLLDPTSVQSADGRYVVFETKAALLSNDKNNQTDVYVRDLLTNKVSLVSINKTGKGTGKYSSGVCSYANSYGGQTISANGRYVMFQSFVDDLVANDKNLGQDIFVRDLLAKKTIRASLDKSGKLNKLLLNSIGLGMSDNGQTVVFASFQATVDQNNTFTYDNTTNKTTLLSRDYNQAPLNDVKTSNPLNLSISHDGSVALFASLAENLVQHDTNKKADIFVRDVKTGLTKLISMNKTGAASGQGESYPPVLSADGKVAIFKSFADNLVM